MHLNAFGRTSCGSLLCECKKVTEWKYAFKCIWTDLLRVAGWRGTSRQHKAEEMVGAEGNAIERLQRRGGVGLQAGCIEFGDGVPNGSDPKPHQCVNFNNI